MLALNPSDISGQDDSWCRQLGNFQPPTSIRGQTLISSVDRLVGSALQAPPSAARRARRVHPIWASHFLLLIFGLVIAAVLFGSSPAMAQGMPGGGMGGHGGRGSHSGNDHNTSANKPDTSPSHIPNPLRALLGEMPRLRAELMLNSTQIGPWSAMEDAMRDCVELSQSRMPAGDGNGEAPDPQLFVQDMADNEHALSEGLARLTATMKTALATLNPRQQKLSRERFATALDSEMPHAVH